MFTPDNTTVPCAIFVSAWIWLKALMYTPTGDISAKRDITAEGCTMDGTHPPREIISSVSLARIALSPIVSKKLFPVNSPHENKSSKEPKISNPCSVSPVRSSL